MVDPHSPTATKVRSRTLQKLEVASAYAFLSTFVCKTSKRSSVYQDSWIRVNLNKDVPTLWHVSGILNPIEHKQYDTNVRYSAVSAATIISTSVPLNTMCNSLSISALKYAPGMSTNATSLTSSASVVAVSMTSSVKTVGDVAYFGSILPPCFLLSPTPRPFINPSRFYFRNISRASDSWFFFSERFYVLTDWNVSLLWSCSSFEVIAFSPFFLDLLSPRFIDSCVGEKWIIITWNPYLFV